MFSGNSAAWVKLVQREILPKPRVAGPIISYLLHRAPGFHLVETTARIGRVKPCQMFHAQPRPLYEPGKYATGMWRLLHHNVPQVAVVSSHVTSLWLDATPHSLPALRASH